MTFSKRLDIEGAGSFNESRVTFCYAKRNCLFSSFIILGAGYLYIVSSMILQVYILSGTEIRKFAGQPSFKLGYKVWQILLTPCLVLHPWFFELNNFLSSGHLLPDALMLPVNCNPVYAAKRLNKRSSQLLSPGFGWCGTQTLGYGQGVACITL